MTEIPEHLLKRSRERKAALSGEAPAEASEPTTAVEPVAATSAAPAVAASAPVPDVPAEPEPVKVAPYVEAYEARKKMPFWIIPVLLTLPVWAAMYVGTLERVPQGLTGLLGEGEHIYVESGCSGCHGAEGGGGIGPQLSDGEVHITFTSLEDQMDWIIKGSAVVGTGNNYASADATRERAVSGQMPGYGVGNTAVLDFEQLLAVTAYEREHLDAEDDQVERLRLFITQADLMIETGELEAILAEDGRSIHDVLDPETSSPDLISEYLAPVWAALPAEEG